MGKKQVVEEIQLLEVTKIAGELYTTSSCTWMELFSIVRGLLDTLANESGGKVSYNDLLDDLKEIGVGEAFMQ